MGVGQCSVLHSTMSPILDHFMNNVVLFTQDQCETSLSTKSKVDMKWPQHQSQRVLQTGCYCKQGIYHLTVVNHVFKILKLLLEFLHLHRLPYKLKSNLDQQKNLHEARRLTLAQVTQTSSRYLPLIITTYLTTNSTSSPSHSICSLSWRPLIRSS